MEVKKIDLRQQDVTKTQVAPTRPVSFSDFIGQDDIVDVIKTAISSSKKSNHTLGHILFSGNSGYGKTTLAHIIANEMGVNIKVVTGYAITKPSELISILNNLQEGDILFIDEIHRLKPTVEEVLYIAMEDRVIDFVMPEGGSMRIPINNFTLIGATTKLESLSAPFKNRFVYKFHFHDYSFEQILKIIHKYLHHYSIIVTKEILERIGGKVEHTPREIHNLCIKLRDYLIAAEKKELKLLEEERATFERWLNVDEGGLTSLHRKYLAILAEHTDPVGIKTLSAKLSMHEKAIEQDIEPLLLKLGKIEKTTRGRLLRQ